MVELKNINDNYIEDTEFNNGVRIIILNDGIEEDTLIADIIENKSKIGLELLNRINNWIGESYSKEAFLIYPSNKFGCKEVKVIYNNELQPENDRYDNSNTLTIYFVDSVYRNNEFFKIQKQAEINKITAANKKKVAGKQLIVLCYLYCSCNDATEKQSYFDCYLT